MIYFSFSSQRCKIRVKPGPGFYHAQAFNFTDFCYAKNMKKRGKIIPNGVSLEKHENETVVFFTELGFTIELIPPSNTPKAKTPDFLMNGVAWEMKCPQGKSYNSLEHIVANAAKQSENIVIDLRHSPLDEEKAISVIVRRAKQIRKIKRFKVIAKNQKVLDIKG